MNLISIIAISIVTNALVNMIFMGEAVAFTESMQKRVGGTSYDPQDSIDFMVFMSANPLVALGLFVVIIGGCITALGYNIYNIFFRYKKK